MINMDIEERVEKLECNYNELNTNVKLLTQAMENNTKTTEKRL